MNEALCSVKPQKMPENMNNFTKTALENSSWFTLAGLRDALLPKLLSGAIRIKNAE
jgi:hypothetical protein